jgi:predicted nucleic acid-binding protein
MQSAFPDAEVTGYDGLIDQMTCDPKDRHVLAAAVRSNAEVIVTFNLQDFPLESVAHYDIDVVHPAEFLALIDRAGAPKFASEAATRL